MKKPTKSSLVLVVAAGGPQERLLHAIAEQADGSGWKRFPAGRSCVAYVPQDGGLLRVTLVVARLEQLPTLTHQYRICNQWAQERLPHDINAAKFSGKGKRSINGAVAEILRTIPVLVRGTRAAGPLVSAG